MRFLSVFIGLLIVCLIFSIILAWPVMLLWNGCLVPAVTVCRDISFWQAFGLSILFSMLFKSSSTNTNSN